MTEYEYPVDFVTVPVKEYSKFHLACAVEEREVKLAKLKSKKDKGDVYERQAEEIEQLRTDVRVLMDERDEAFRESRVLRKVARRRRDTITNLQQKVTEQAAELENVVKVARVRVDHWQEKLVKAEADRDTFKKQAYAENERLSAVRKLVQDLEKKVEADLNANPASYSWVPSGANPAMRKGEYESATASIARGFATKKILDRIKLALAEGELTAEAQADKAPEYFSYPFGEKAKPTVRYWKSTNGHSHWRGTDRPSEVIDGDETSWRPATWKSIEQLSQHFSFTEITAAELPEGVTP